MVQQPKKILVVDDEKNSRIALSAILAHEGYNVASAENGAEALNYLQSRTVDLIITDINMPVMDGLTFLRKLEKKGCTCNVIIVTAYGEAESSSEDFDIAIYEHINKPVKVDELKKTIHKIFKSG